MKLIVISVFFLLCAIPLVEAQSPPNPRTITGRVMTAGYVAGLNNGVPVQVNNTALNQIFMTSTNAPELPNLLGTYSVDITGSNGQLVRVTAWNGTHWGANASSISGRTTEIDVQLNNTRSSEANITSLLPLNHSRFHAGTPFNITVNITWMGINGTDCNVTLDIENTSIIVLNASENFTLPLGNVSYNERTFAMWNVTGNRTGATNITVSSRCTPNTHYFYTLHTRSSFNITIYDNTTPIITPLSPPNNSVRANNTNISFIYTVTDDLPISACRFYVDGLLNETNTTIVRGSQMAFTTSFQEGNYTWSINCTDISSTPNTGTTGIFNISIRGGAPLVLAVNVDNPIFLQPGGTRRITCNASILDSTGAADITNVNATFFHVTSSLDAPNDFNVHYTNTSCTNTSGSSDTKNYTCAMDLQYYANSSEWTCTIMAIDSTNTVGFLSASTNVSELVAINVSPSIIDYGLLAPANTSLEDENITVSNIGNVPYNISLRAFATVPGDNLSMNCAAGNISVELQRVSLIPETVYTAMEPLNGSFEVLPNFVVPSRTNDTAPMNDSASLFWKLRIPAGIGGRCNGTVTVSGTRG